jgi:hypothetical protein
MNAVSNFRSACALDKAAVSILSLLKGYFRLLITEALGS